MNILKEVLTLNFFVFLKSNQKIPVKSLLFSYKEFSTKVLENICKCNDVFQLQYFLSCIYVELFVCEESVRGYIKKKLLKKALLLIKLQIDFCNNVNYVPDNKDEKVNNEKVSPHFYWSRSKSDIVELAYAIIETKSLNNGEVDIKDVISYLSNVFNLEIKNHNNTFISIRQRKDNRTLFLDELKESLLKRMDKLDNGEVRKQRFSMRYTR